jgi:hypothetical protein
LSQPAKFAIFIAKHVRDKFFESTWKESRAQKIPQHERASPRRTKHAFYIFKLTAIKYANNVAKYKRHVKLFN